MAFELFLIRIASKTFLGFTSKTVKRDVVAISSIISSADATSMGCVTSVLYLQKWQMTHIPIWCLKLFLKNFGNFQQRLQKSTVIKIIKKTLKYLVIIINKNIKKFLKLLLYIKKDKYLYNLLYH